MIVDINDEDMKQTVFEMECIWSDLIPDVTFKASQIEQDYADIYLSADRQVTLFLAFSILAFTIAGLGLFGLSAHMAERKTKEIGIRKVLGAKNIDIMFLFTWQFTKLVFIAAPLGLLISIPTLNNWLLNFAYRLSLIGNLWVFVVAISIAMIVAWLTIGGHAFSVARTSPIKALRHE